MKAIFFDRDGVINEIVWRKNLPASPRTMQEWKLNKELAKIMLALKEKGYKIFAVTNQPDVARNLMDKEVLQAMHQDMCDHLPLDEVMACTHDNKDNCECRKPKPGMLLMLAKKWQIDLRQSFMVGDSWKDIDAGKAAGCKTILVDAIYNQKVSADYRIKNLNELLFIL